MSLLANLREQLTKSFLIRQYGYHYTITLPLFMGNKEHYPIHVTHSKGKLILTDYGRITNYFKEKALKLTDFPRFKQILRQHKLSYKNDTLRMRIKEVNFNDFVFSWIVALTQLLELPYSKS